MAELTFTRLDSLAHIVVEGRHRARFLHAMTTAEVQKLAPGDATFALVATSNGRHVGQLRLEIGASAIDLVADQAAMGPIVETLKKHKVADDVRFGQPVPDEATLALTWTGTALPELHPQGSLASPGLLAELLAPAPAPGRFEDRGDLRITAWDEARSEIGQPLFYVRGPVAAVAALEQALRDAGATAMDAATWDARRIANTWPRDGVDLGPEDLALGSERLLATVSWTKGCFLGQEVFVMARDRGEVPKKLRLLQLDAGAFPEPGAALTAADGKTAGALGSSSGPHALAVLKRRAAEPGTSLTLPDGRTCMIAGLASQVSQPA